MTYFIKSNLRNIGFYFFKTRQPEEGHDFESPVWSAMRLQPVRNDLKDYSTVLKTASKIIKNTDKSSQQKEFNSFPNNCLSYALGMMAYGDETYTPSTLAYFDFENPEEQSVIKTAEQLDEDIHAQANDDNFHRHLMHAGIIPLSEVTKKNVDDYTPFAFLQYAYQNSFHNYRQTEFHAFTFDVAALATSHAIIKQKPGFKNNFEILSLKQFQKNAQQALQNYTQPTAYASPISLQNRYISTVQQTENIYKITLGNMPFHS